MFQVGDLVLFQGLVGSIASIKNDMIRIIGTGYGSLVVSSAVLLANQVVWYKKFKGKGGKWRKWP